MEELFLGLPERADRLRDLARLDAPVSQDVDEIARMTDPRAGLYFFRTAVSGRYLEAIRAQGSGALSQAVAVVSEAGMAACPLLAKVVRTRPDRFVLRQVADWARDVPLAERTGAWVGVCVCESILRAREFTTYESWESGQLLRAVVETAHPGGRLRTGADRLGGIIRSVPRWCPG